MKCYVDPIQSFSPVGKSGNVILYAKTARYTALKSVCGLLKPHTFRVTCFSSNNIFVVSCEFHVMQGSISGYFITAHKRSLRRLCFYRCLSVRRRGVHGCWWGACVVAGGGCAWLLAGGACVVAGGGCAWLLTGGACVVAGRGVCVVDGGGGHACGHNASYWNAFLLNMGILSGNQTTVF